MFPKLLPDKRFPKAPLAQTSMAKLAPSSEHVNAVRDRSRTQRLSPKVRSDYRSEYARGKQA